MDGHGVRHTRAPLAVADRLLVRLRPNADEATVAAAVGGRVARRLRSGLTILALPTGTDVMTAAATLRGNPRVALVEPDGVVYPDLATVPPNDPGYSQQYHLPLIQAPLAWTVTQGLASIVVAVVDTGVQLSHPEFAGRIWQNPSPTVMNSAATPPYNQDLNGWNFVDNNGDVSPHAVSGQLNEQVGHGTLVAGTIGAVANNGQGGCGVDWNCKIMPVKIFDANNGSPVSTVIEGITYAWQHGAQVINLSLGSSTYFDTFTQPVHDAYAGTAAYPNRSLLVCAAGNEYRAMTPGNQSTWESPVCNQWVDPNTGLTVNDIMGVAATDQHDLKASFSNWAPASTQWVDVSAPGVTIYGPAYYDPANNFNTYYTTNDGTSFSTPIVSGVAAMILSLHPTYSPDDLTNIIRATADNIDAKNTGYAGQLGTGRVDLARALGIAIPPAVPTDFHAADTAGDNGGSITLTWTKSGDDGAGAMSVTGYNIYRGLASSGLTLLTATPLPPGTQTFADATTVDGTNYWYQLEVVAGTQTARAAVVGPAVSRNDAPPPLISMLTALDHPNDAGGAIDLDWTGYVAPADFLQYRVYRSQPNVRPSNITGMTLLTTLTDPTAHQYTDSTTQDGADYYYAVTGKDTAGNENTQLSLAGPVQSFPNGQIALPQGQSFLAAGAIPTDQDPATLFGLPPAQLNYSRWNPTLSQYETYSAGTPLSASLMLALGRGFWVNLAAPLTFATTGTIAPAGAFAVTMQAGWQQVGNPFLAPLDFSTATVYSNSTTMDLASARSRRVMSNVAWVYDNSAGIYRLAYPDLGQGASQIPPWRGFWVYSFGACQLNLQRPGTTTQGITPAAAGSASVTPASVPVQFSGNEFGLLLSASAGGATTPANYCGVASALSDYWTPAPPPARSGVEMAFTSGPQTAQATGPSMVSYAPKLTLDLKWAFVVSTPLAQASVTVACANVAKVPGNYNIILRDVDGGRQQSLRQQPQYTYTSAADGGVRHFELDIVPRTTAQVAVTGMMTQAVRGAGAQLMFTLSAPATTSVAVMNIAGIPIRTVESNRLRPAGANVAVWDGRNAGGAAVPGGMYLMRLEASDDSGNRVSALRTLNVTR